MLTLKKGYSNVHAKMNGANWNVIGNQSLSVFDLFNISRADMVNLAIQGV